MRLVNTREIDKIIELGQETKELYEAILKVNNLANHILGKRHSISKTTLKLHNKIVALKSDFEDEFYIDLNKNIEKPINCFYGEDNPTVKAKDKPKI